jgi:methionyl-tRNA formyltransferase
MVKALFLGSKQLGLRLLDCVRTADPSVSWAIIHPDDRADARSRLTDFHRYVRDHDLEMTLVASAAETKRAVLSASADIALVSGWYWILDEVTIRQPPLGMFGIHNSLLPKYRGGSPLIWSIINGDPQVGATVFCFTTGMDDGAMPLQVKVLNEPHDTVATLLHKIETALFAELPKCWRALLDGSALLTSQDENEATYCGQRTPDDGLIDWTWNARRVHNFIRAQMPPYPGAFSFVGDAKMTFLRAEPDTRIFFGTPGQVLLRRAGTVAIACGEASALLVREVLVDGVSNHPASFIRSISSRFQSAASGQD